MKFIASLIAGVTAASAAALPRDSESSGQWDITDFSYSGVRTSLYEYCRLSVSDGKDSTTCSVTTSVGPLPSITSFPYTPCADSCWSFGFFYTQVSPSITGYSLQITREVTEAGVTKNQTACRFFPSSDVKTTNDTVNPNANYQYLDAPESFTLTWQDQPCVYA